MNVKLCACGKQKPLSKCCGQFLTFKKKAKTPEQLMRSRFTAYALGGHGEYLMSTWLETSAKSLTALALSEKTVDWQRLEIISSTQAGGKGTVEFKAWFCESRNSDTLECMHEISEFVRIKSCWFYVSGRAG